MSENNIALFANTLEKMKGQFALALPKHMSAERLTRIARSAYMGSKALQECSQQSILSSLMTAAQIGLEPGINGHGYLIPYKGVCTFVPGWRGLVDLVSRAGRATVWTGVVYAGDQFDYQLGDEPFCRHKPADGGGEFTHIYAIGRVKGADMPVIEVWTRGKAKKHLNQYNKVGNRHYANANENNFEMYARKVALLQVLKYMPSSVELSNAIDLSNAVDGGGIAAKIEDGFVVVDNETGEIFEAEDKKKPVMTDDDFKSREERLKNLISSGKTSGEIIQTLELKFELSDVQKENIIKWENEFNQSKGK
jgi:recombination protein RecT